MCFEPYLHFQGNCRAAMTAYHQIFGGELHLMPYSEAPGASDAAKASDLIMHSALSIAGRMLFASDFPPEMKGDPQQAVTVSHTAATIETARAIFDKLSEGGALIMPFQPTFWSDGFGMVKDRFGTHWMVSAPWRQA